MMFDADEIEISLANQSTAKDTSLDQMEDAAMTEQESISSPKYFLNQKQYAKINEAKFKFNKKYFQKMAH